jgi:putative heme-binding domain-containing protein
MGAPAEHANRPTENANDSTSLRGNLFQMVNDPDSGVRFRLALALRSYNDPGAPRALATLLEREDAPLMQLAILCGAGRNGWPLLRELLEDEHRSRQHTDFLEQLGEQVGYQVSQKSLAECLDWTTANLARSNSAGGLATLAGLTRGLFQRGRSLRDSGLPVELLSKGVTDRLRATVLTAEALAEDTSRSVEDRTRAMVIAANGEWTEVEHLVRNLVKPSQPQPVQSAAVWAARQANCPGAWRALFSQWTGHTASTRQAMLDEALHSTAGIDALVTALEADILSAEELPASMREILGELQDESLRRRVEPLLAAIVPADRAQVLARYADAANRRGDSARGATIFKQLCQTCHAIQGIGKRVGPDLASISSRRSDLLLVDILDPSRQVSPDFVNYVVVTQDGRVMTGLIAAETAESVTLRREDGHQETIQRSEIEQFRASGKSMMPDGLEKNLTPDQIADLLEFLHHPDVDQLN